MKSLTFATVVAALAAVTSARKCQNITVSVSITAPNRLFNFAAPANDIEVTNFILDLTQQSGNFFSTIYQGIHNVSGTYNLATTYCEPDCGPSSTVQLLTHGIGFDRSYWDLSFNNYNYSYVQEAVDQYGYSTLTWDRLGVGQSSHGEPVNEIQAQLEIQALRALTVKLRAGTIPGVPKAQKVVHVGHSFGSTQTYALSGQYPDLSDGIVLTGFSQNGTFVPYFALGSNFIEANELAPLSAYPNGYLAPQSARGVQIDFFSPRMFDPAILALAFATGQPVTVGELLTVSTATAFVNNFSGPCLVITGNRDIPFCGGNCLATGGVAASIPAMAKATLPNTKNFEAFIVPEAGHGLNLEYSHPLTYGTILNYLLQNGLGPNGCSAGQSSSASAPASAAPTKMSASAVAASVTKSVASASSTGWGRWSA